MRPRPAATRRRRSPWLAGRLFEWMAPFEMTPEEKVAAKVNLDYAKFIAIRPWYEFDYAAAMDSLWQARHQNAPGFLRRLERRFILSVEFLIKRCYAAII